MDDLVRRAMQRWPDVPAVYGWLRLDRRGRWMLVDRGRLGFDEVRDAAGSPITSEQIVEFIGRNYQADPQGRACGRCDACRLRAQGFADAGVADPTRYR